MAAARNADVLDAHGPACGDVASLQLTSGLKRQGRSDLVTGRGTLRHPEAGREDIDPDTAAAMLDQVLATARPHDAGASHTAPDVLTGREQVTCLACVVTRYASYRALLAHIIGDRSPQ